MNWAPRYGLIPRICIVGGGVAVGAALRTLFHEGFGSQCHDTFVGHLYVPNPCPGAQLVAMQIALFGVGAVLLVMVLHRKAGK